MMNTKGTLKLNDPHRDHELDDESFDEEEERRRRRRRRRRRGDEEDEETKTRRGERERDEEERETTRGKKQRSPRDCDYPRRNRKLIGPKPNRFEIHPIHQNRTPTKTTSSPICLSQAFPLACAACLQEYKVPRTMNLANLATQKSFRSSSLTLCPSLKVTKALMSSSPMSAGIPITAQS